MRLEPCQIGVADKCAQIENLGHRCDTASYHCIRMRIVWSDLLISNLYFQCNQWIMIKYWGIAEMFEKRMQLTYKAHFISYSWSFMNTLIGDPWLASYQQSKQMQSWLVEPLHIDCIFTINSTKSNYRVNYRNVSPVDDYIVNC